MILTIGPAEMQTSSDPQVTLLTEPLGAGIGVAAYDAGANAGGILYYVLPTAFQETSGRTKTPFLFADIGVPMFFDALARVGAQARRMKVVVAGGASILNSKGDFDIAGRNLAELKTQFKQNRIPITYEALGGNSYRRIRMIIQTGRIHVVTPGRMEERV